MHIFVCLDALLHDLIDVVDVLSDVLSHVGVQRQLILLELLLLFTEQDSCLLEIFIEVEANLILKTLFH